MPLDGAPSGWDWFAAGTTAAADPEELELCREFAHCFAGPAGRRNSATTCRATSQ